jgi:hypothetical protein
MATFGYTSVGANSGNDGTSNWLVACYFISPSDCGLITQISVYMAAASVSINAKAFLYAAGSGKPGALLAASNQVAVGTAPGWVNFTINYTGSPSTGYWLAIMGDGNYNVYWDTNGSSGQLQDINTGLTFPNAPNPWTTSTYTWAYNMSIYATYTPGAAGTGVSLDGQGLTVLKWTETLTPVNTFEDRWMGQQCKHVPHTYGSVRTYQLDCVEQNVAWANSLVSYFEQKAASGAIVSFTSGLVLRAVNTVNVYVLSVTWSAENLGGQNIRTFTLALQEA